MTPAPGGFAVRHVAILAVVALTAGGGLATTAWPSAAQTPPAALESAPDRIEAVLAQLQSDPVAALAQLERWVAEGDAEAMTVLGLVLDAPPDSVAADRPRALALLRRAAELGSETARLNLGSAFVFNNTAQDDAEGVALLQSLSEPQTIELASYPLGRAYLFGTGADQDLARGAALVRQAVERDPDNADARFLLGRASQNGWGVPVDEAAAYGHLRAAADLGNARAQWIAGMMLLQGQGVPSDPAAAYGLVRQSAEGGDVQGQISLAVMLALGQGVEPDPAQARDWYRLAAEGGSAHAMRGLGMMLLTGQGGATDAVRGAALLELAADAGEPVAIDLRVRHAAELAQLDRAAVDQAKSEWIAAHGAPQARL